MITLEQFCTCTKTFQQHPQEIDPYPWQPDSVKAIIQLQTHIIQPIINHFGKENFILTYGFCSTDLKKFLSSGRNQTCCKVDQHCAHELNRKGNQICDRDGAACDFHIKDLPSDQLVKWILNHQIPFDSIYYYGSQKPIHISHGPQHKQICWNMKTGIPKKLIGDSL